MQIKPSRFMPLDEDLAKLLTASPGQATWGRQVVSPESDSRQVAIMALLDCYETKRVRDGAFAEHRAKCFIANSVALIVWMACVDGCPDWLFETWINIQGESPFPELKEQDALYVLLFEKPPIFFVETRPVEVPEFVYVKMFETSERPVRVLKSPNRLNWAEMLAAAQGLGRWSLDDFDARRSQFCERYPSPDALWDALR